MENSEYTGRTPGELLRQAREGRGISVKDMAMRLKLVGSQIKAIEENRFEVLPDKVFVRGYLRAYGRAVDMPEADLLAGYEALVSSAEESQEPVAETPTIAREPFLQNTTRAIVAGVVLALLLIAGLWWSYDTPPPRPGGFPAPEEVIESAGAAGTATDPADSATDSDMDPGMDPDVDPDTAASEPADSSTAPLPARPAAINADASVLLFNFSGTCWLEVRDSQEQLIYQNLHEDGDELQVVGVAPFNILVGAAQNVQLIYRGAPVAIKPRPGTALAHFRVGTL